MSPEQRASLALFGDAEFKCAHDCNFMLADGEIITHEALTERYRSEGKKLYLAAPFADRPKMENVANILQQRGYTVVARWVYGGEDGLTREQIARLDLDDVDKADAVVSFTFPRGTLTSGGGRHVEFGYALAKGKRCIVIGHRENVFHHAEGVEVYATLEDWLACVPVPAELEMV